MPSHNNAGLSTGTVESVAGLSAGAVSTLVVHPLDLVKTRMQSTSPARTPFLGTLRELFADFDNRSLSLVEPGRSSQNNDHRPPNSRL